MSRERAREWLEARFDEQDITASLEDDLVKLLDAPAERVRRMVADMERNLMTAKLDQHHAKALEINGFIRGLEFALRALGVET